MQPITADAAPVDPLIVEAMRKAAVAWLTVAHHRPYPVWCLWVDDALYLVSGAGEQEAPGLTRATTVAVTARGDHGGSIVTWTAAPALVPPGGAAWAAVVPMLAAKRLNSDNAQDLAARWAAECTVTRLTPTHLRPRVDQGIYNGFLGVSRCKPLDQQ